MAAARQRAEIGGFSIPAKGNQVGATNTFNNLPILEGLFSVEVDFGASAFDNHDRWLEITVDGVPLVPRQPVTRAPYAIQTRGIIVDENGIDAVGMDNQSPFTVTPSSLEFKLEGALFARSQVNQTIELLDYFTGSWEQADIRVATRFSDSTVTATATGDLSRFVEAGTICLEARIRYQATSAGVRFD